MKPPAGATRWQRIAIWLTGHLPPTLVRETERVVLAAGITCTGIGSLLATSTPGTIATVLPVWLLVEWSLTLIVGGVFTLIGMFTGRRTVERAGITLTGLGAVTYAGALAYVGGPRAWIVALLFLAVSLAALIRLASSTAANATVNPPIAAGDGADRPDGA